MKHIEDIKQIHCIAYVHADHAWTNTRQWHIKRYIEGMSRVLDYMKVNPSYTFLIDNILHYLVVIERFLPNRIEEVRQYVREGRICIANGGMALARPDSYGAELYLRNMAAGHKLLKERFPEADIFMAFNADTGIGHSQMPQLLNLLGHSHYQCHRPDHSLDHDQLPKEFWWQGLDGTKILTSRCYYGSFMDAHCCDPDNEAWVQKKDAFVAEELEVRLRNTESAELLLFIGSDDTYPQKNVWDRDTDIDGFMQEWNEHEQSSMHYSTLRTYHEALKRQNLPVWKGICDPVGLFYDYPVRSHLALSRFRLNSEKTLLLCERLEVILNALSGQVKSNTITELWNKLFEFSGHAMQWLLSDDYEEMLEKAAITLCAAKQYQRELLLQIAHSAGSNRQDTYLAINPCSFQRTDTIQIQITTAEHIHGLKLYDDSGEEIQYQIVEVYDGDKPYVNKDYNEVRIACTITMPAMSIRRIYAVCDNKSICEKADYECYEVANALDASKEIVIQNGTYSFTIKNAIVTQIQHRNHSAASQGWAGELRYYEARPNPEWLTDWDKDVWHSFRPATLMYKQRGPERFVLQYDGTIDDLPASVALTITKDSPSVAYDVSFDAKEKEGYFSFVYVCDEQPNIQAGIPYGTELRDLKNICYCRDSGISETDYLYYERGTRGGFFANRFTSFINGQHRILLTRGDGSYLYRYDAQRNEVEQLMIRSLDMSTRSQNWMRHVHPSFSSAGSHTFSFSVSALDAADNLDMQEKIVSSVMLPIQSVPLYDHQPITPTSATQAIEEIPTELTVTACYMQENTIILRFFENRGIGWAGNLAIPQHVRQVQMCDLMGNVIRQLAVENHQVSLSVAPWQIVTLHLL